MHALLFCPCSLPWEVHGLRNLCCFRQHLENKPSLWDSWQCTGLICWFVCCGSSCWLCFYSVKDPYLSSVSLSMSMFFLSFLFSLLLFPLTDSLAIPTSASFFVTTSSAERLFSTPFLLRQPEPACSSAHIFTKPALKILSFNCDHRSGALPYNHI